MKRIIPLKSLKRSSLPPLVIPAKAGIPRLRGKGRLQQGSSLLLLAAALLVSCGSDPSTKAASRTTGPDGTIGGSAKLIVTNSQSVDKSRSYGIIKTYKVSVSGEGISEPIVAEFEGDATEGVVDGIPVGIGRTVNVQAINIGERLIREGEAAGVTISPSETSEVDIEMDAVPIFTNLADGNVVPSTRLRFEVFADPDEPLEIQDVTSGKPASLFDVSTNAGEIYPDLETGLGIMAPGEVIVGEHVYKVVSKRTGRSSNVSVKVVDGRKIFPAPFFSAGRVDISGDYIGLARAGSGLHMGPTSGAAWPNYVGQIFTGE